MKPVYTTSLPLTTRFKYEEAGLINLSENRMPTYAELIDLLRIRNIHVSVQPIHCYGKIYYQAVVMDMNKLRSVICGGWTKIIDNEKRAFNWALKQTLKLL